jgi:peptidoglycan/LPS O-acetylase OafA/YrhL
VTWLRVAGPESAFPAARRAGALLNRLFRWRFLTFLGKHSLQVYAYHVVVVYVVLGFDARIGPFSETTKTLIALAAIVSLIVPAWVHANWGTWVEGSRLAAQPQPQAAQGRSRN